MIVNFKLDIPSSDCALESRRNNTVKVIHLKM